jgi:hypothetical protein
MRNTRPGTEPGDLLEQRRDPQMRVVGQPDPALLRERPELVRPGWVTPTRHPTR